MSDREHFRSTDATGPAPAAASARRSIGAVALVLALSVAAVGRAAESGDPPEETDQVQAAARIEGAAADAAEGVTVDGTWFVPRTESEIKIDARLDEPAWGRALEVEIKYETRPGENVPARVRTFAYVTFDERSLYVAFKALDPDPKKIRAHLSDRDTAWNDDWVGVVLDTFNDERRAFEFFVNPLGVQMDMIQDDVTRREDAAWDAIWSSEGRLTEEGYVVELAIPFYSLRFPSGSGVQTWGVDLLRNYPRSDRVRLRSQPEDRDLNCYLCQISKMSGFDNITAGRNIELVPTVVSGRTDAREDSSSTELAEGDFESEVGFTAKWGVTPNLTFLGTINPDFSQVEADVAQLDVNTQFALFFPERRPFFMDGADFFDTPLGAVFTRNVADPDWGVKLTGKMQANGIGVFAAQDAVTNLIFPGSQGSSGESFDFETLDSVVRYRRDVGENSALGAIVTNRAGDDYSNLVAGVDGVIRFMESNSVTFQYLGSQTEYPMEIVEDYEQPLGSFSDEAYRVALNHNSRNWNAWARYEDIGTDFRSDMGFMPRVDYEMVVGGAQHIWWGEDKDWWTSIRFGGDWDRTRDQSGQVLEQETELFGTLSGPRQSFLWFGGGTRDRHFDGVDFDDQRFVNSWFEIQPTGSLFFGMFTGLGDTIDFANTQPAEQIIWEPQVRYNIGKHIKINLSYEMQRLDRDEGELFEASLTQLRFVYQFNVRTFARLIAQYSDIVRNPELYDDEVDAQNEQLFTQLLFSYKLNPRTVAFVGYSETRVGENGSSAIADDRSVFVKIGYSWIL